MDKNTRLSEAPPSQEEIETVIEWLRWAVRRAQEIQAEKAKAAAEPAT